MAARGLLQRDLALALGVSQTQISERIRGTIDWRLSELRTVAAIVRIPLAELTSAPSDVPSDDDAIPSQPVTAVTS